MRKESEMLMEISSLITPEVFEIIYRMGHLDELVIADANYRASAMSQRMAFSHARKNGDLLSAILKYFPLDEDENYAVTVMIPDRGYDHEPEIWKEYKKVLEDNGYMESFTVNKVERVEFYEKTKKAYATIQTDDSRLFADMILRKGFVVE